MRHPPSLPRRPSRWPPFSADGDSAGDVIAQIGRRGAGPAAAGARRRWRLGLQSLNETQDKVQGPGAVLPGQCVRRHSSRWPRSSRAWPRAGRGSCDGRPDSDSVGHVSGSSLGRGGHGIRSTRTSVGTIAALKEIDDSPCFKLLQ